VYAIRNKIKIIAAAAAAAKNTIEMRSTNIAIGTYTWPTQLPAHQT
jgi:hypothetical protein